MSKISNSETFTFDKIEKILGFDLPKSAYSYQAWWENDDQTHTHARAWLDAGMKTSSVKLGISVTFTGV